MNEHGGAIAQVPAVPLPAPRAAINIRAAAASDLPFIDGLMKMHSHMVGFAPMKQLVKNVADGQVIIAEEDSPARTQLGYCIAKDHYLKREDVGIIYQLNVMPVRQRHLIGASLVKACFERAPYGVKLFCCWCAQDIQANSFWEGIGFVPLAFRTGSRGKQRTHIFWQRRIRENDVNTDYWYPSQTSAGAVGEDRIVLPIPPDTHWRDAKPLVLPGVAAPGSGEAVTPLALPAKRPKTTPEQISQSKRAAVVRSSSRHLKGLPPGKAAIMTSGGIRYVERGDYVPEPEPPKPKREKKPRQKHDPKHVLMARELRDKYLEQVNSGLLLPPMNGKYEVCRRLEAAPIGRAGAELKQILLLKAA